LGAANTYLATIENPPAVPTILFGLLIPLAVAAIALWRSDSIARLVFAIPLYWLVAGPGFPVRGGLFLTLVVVGRLAPPVCPAAGIGDVATGIVAVVVAAQLAQNAIGARRATYAWCLFGIADLVVAITMGAMTSPGRAHLLAFDAPNLLMTAYPLVMVPTFAVPLALMLHGLVLSRLPPAAAPPHRRPAPR